MSHRAHRVHRGGKEGGNVWFRGDYSREMLTSLGVVAEDAHGRFRFRHDGMDGHDCSIRRRPGVV